MTAASGESTAAGGESTDASGESSGVTKEGSSHHLSNVHNRMEEEAEEAKVIADIVETAITTGDSCVLKLRTRYFVSLFYIKCVILEIINIIM